MADVADSRALALDDCWNRIGVRGDQSCERLADYVRCLNCPVYEDAAARLLDRPIPRIELADSAMRSLPSARDANGAEHDVESCLIFRLGVEWLALPTSIFQRVVHTRTIHSLPHRQHRALLGVVTVQGALVVCVSLARLLGFDSDAQIAGTETTLVQPRLLVVERDELLAAIPADQVDGVHRLERAAFQAVPSTLSHAAAAHTRAVIAWRGKSLGVLDADALFATLARSLA